MPANDKKYSQFTEANAFSSGDYFVGLKGGVNTRFSYSTIYKALSGLGSLSSIGNGSPILDQPVAGVNQIRTIEAEKGTTVGLTAQNGLKVGNSFQQSTGGEAIIPDLLANTYTIKTIKTTSPLNISSDSESITIGFDESPLAATNTVVVSDITDFPNAVGGVITLEDNTIYILVQPITTSNRFVLGANNAITANNIFSPLFTYTGSDAMFTGTDINFDLKEISLAAPNGTFFDLTGTATDSANILMREVFFTFAQGMGNFTDLATLSLANCGSIDVQQGLRLFGADYWRFFNIDRFSLESTSPTFVGIDFGTSEHEIVRALQLIINGVAVGSVGISGLPNNGNIKTGFQAVFEDGGFENNITPLSGITINDCRYMFSSNGPLLADSMTDVLAEITGNASATVISASSNDGSNAVKMAGTWVSVYSNRFTFDVSGRWTYDCEKEERMPIDVNVNMVPSSGSNKQCAAYIAINGTVVATTGMTATVSTTQAGHATAIYQHNFQQGDYVEVWLENQTDTTNIIGQRGIMRIN